MKPSALLPLAALLAAAPAGAQSLTVISDTVTAVSDPTLGPLYHYDYEFINSDTTTPINSVGLTSDDLAPLNLAILKNNAATSWDQLATPDPTLLSFYSFGDALAPLDTLNVQFDDPAPLFAPTNGHAVFSGASFQPLTPTGGIVPGPAAVPEPAPLALMAPVGGLLLTALARRKRRAA